MATVMTNTELVKKLKSAATDYKTLYVMGCFGAPMTAANKERYIRHNSYNAASDRRKMIEAATEDTFGFDCVCLVKGILWGWSGDKNALYGGAGYCANGVPDIGTEQMSAVCSGVSTDFSAVIPGELLHSPGHVGVYIGDGLAVECTPAWDNGVQITAVGNIGTAEGYNTRTWRDHGRLPYVDYTDVENTSANAELTYTVRSGDCLWAIAERYLGDGFRYTEIMEYNGLDSVAIYAGQVLRIPTEKKTAAPATRTYTVKAGDSPWGIARSELGDGTRYPEILTLNGLGDGYVIYPGQTLIIPAE